jgi:hypothetical protein
LSFSMARAKLRFALPSNPKSITGTNGFPADITAS